jgi:hypothetical protein
VEASEEIRYAQRQKTNQKQMGAGNQARLTPLDAG